MAPQIVGGDLKYWHDGAVVHGKRKGTQPVDAYWFAGVWIPMAATTATTPFNALLISP
jgi:hypothetical protein